MPVPAWPGYFRKPFGAAGFSLFFFLWLQAPGWRDGARVSCVSADCAAENNAWWNTVISWALLVCWCAFVWFYWAWELSASLVSVSPAAVCPIFFQNSISGGFLKLVKKRDLAAPVSWGSLEEGEQCCGVWGRVFLLQCNVSTTELCPSCCWSLKTSFKTDFFWCLYSALLFQGNGEYPCVPQSASRALGAELGVLSLDACFCGTKPVPLMGSS